MAGRLRWEQHKEKAGQAHKGNLQRARGESCDLSQLSTERSPEAEIQSITFISSTQSSVTPTLGNSTGRISQTTYKHQLRNRTALPEQREFRKMMEKRKGRCQNQQKSELFLVEIMILSNFNR